MTTVNSFDFKTASNFICDNYQFWGGQAFYTASCAIQYLVSTGRLAAKYHNFVSNANGKQLVQMLNVVVKRSKPEFCYSQGHFEGIWAEYLCKKVK